MIRNNSTHCAFKAREKQRRACTPSTSPTSIAYGGFCTSVGVSTTSIMVAVYHHCCGHPHGDHHCGFCSHGHSHGDQHCGFCTAHNAHFCPHCEPFTNSPHGAHFHGYEHGQPPHSICSAVPLLSLKLTCMPTYVCLYTSCFVSNCSA